MTFQTALKELDLTGVVGRVETDLGLSKEDAQRAEVLYRQFLTLCHKYPDLSITPPKLVDEVWHFHIMNTRKYAQDCDNLFGQFIHHGPHKQNAEEDYAHTKELYKKEFNVNLDTYGLPADMLGHAICGVGG